MFSLNPVQNHINSLHRIMHSFSFYFILSCLFIITCNKQYIKHHHQVQLNGIYKSYDIILTWILNVDDSYYSICDKYLVSMPWCSKLGHKWCIGLVPAQFRHIMARLQGKCVYVSYVCVLFMTLWPSEAIWWHRLSAPSHYLNQCWIYDH